MNPIVYNKNGQYRFTDFVGYLPEFLRSEPDVVTFLQVMSDYINNAYRNVEVTEEFELIKVCTSSDRTIVQKKMESLCELFKLACDRGEYVLYLSAPRNNVKSNITVGSENAEYQRTIELDLDEIADMIPAATSRVGSSLDDGDIVYVKYTKRPLAELVAYYYAKDANQLIKDLMTTSQDPFTGTYNNPTTAIQFKVTEVGNVVCRYGGNHGDIVYYEVYLPIHITNVERIPASGIAEYDVDGDGKIDEILVDYYNLTSATSGDTFNTFIKFSDRSGFAWTGNFPGGLFYFRDSSVAKLTNVGKNASMDISDTIKSPSVDRYHINRIEKNAGVYRVYLDAFPGVYENAIFYILKGSENLGVYRMNGTITDANRFDSGSIYIDLINVSGIDVDLDQSPLTLISIPLAASKYVIDFDNSLPMVKWTSEIDDLFEHTVGFMPNMYMKRAVVADNPKVYTGFARRYSVYTLQVSTDLSSKIHVGTVLWSQAFMSLDDESSPCVAQVQMVDYGPDGSFRIMISGAKINVAALVNEIDLYVVKSGYVTNERTDLNAVDNNLFYVNAVWESDINLGDYVVVDVSVNGAADSSHLLKVHSINRSHNGGTIAFYKPEGISLSIDTCRQMKLVSIDKETQATIYSFNYVKRQEDGNTIIGVANKNASYGDIFSAHYMLAAPQGTTDYSLLNMSTDVQPMTTNAMYETGDYIYDPSTNNVLLVTRTLSLDEYGNVSDVNNTTVDRLAHYSVGFRKISNTYMPYCGPVSALDYEDHVNYANNMKTGRLPLYIKKVNDVRLKYGWQQRQYVYYNDNIGVQARSRAGFTEFYADTLYGERSPVNINLRKSAHLLPANTVLSGCGTRFYTIDIDSVPIAQRSEQSDWVITVQSSDHGLSDGTVIKAVVDTEDADELAVFTTESSEITVLSPDVFQYTTKAPNVTGYIIKLESTAALTVTYDRSYSDDPATYPNEGDVVVVGADIVDLTRLDNYEYRDDIYPVVDNTQIAVGGTLYLVTAGEWKVISPSDILTPHAIYSRHNLFDVSKTNPTFAKSDGYVIKSIVPDNENHVAEILLTKRIPELDSHNSGTVFNGKGRVYIEFVNQGALCGWHTIKEVHNGGAFSIYLDPYTRIDDFIAPITNRQMTVYVGRWYKYTLNGYDWDKKSNLVSYMTSNEIMEHPSEIAFRYKMKYKHGMSVGDHVLIDSTGKNVYSLDDSVVNEIIEANVTRVIDEYTVELDVAYDRDGYIYKGYIISDRNLSRLNGEYSIVMNGKLVKFRDGDIVILKAQVCLDERRGWKVAANTAWVPMAGKRTFKIDDMMVDMKRNPAYDISDDLDTESEYAYVTYTDVDVYNDSTAYTVDYANARNYHFEHPHVDNLDTTQKTELEYSSKYDYASIAPRDDMDPTFKGVPDMGYPLAERIERLAYLRDPEVIDLDLIGYLARFMGYDITALADDIRSSNVYRNSMEREAAIREAVAHLPQFYALNGTKPGINMLMATFGLIGELVTMWTNTSNPYGELVRQDEVPARMDMDLANGKTTSSWVPTPHVMLDIIENENFNSVLMGNTELTRMKEQIRRCKPIQVVFDGVRIVYNQIIDITARLDTSGGFVSDSTYLLTADSESPLTVSEDPCMTEDCDF